MKTEEKELWKPTHCWDDYEVSNMGRVRRVLSGGGYRYLKPQFTSKGYLRVGIRKKSYRIHRLVAEVFVDGKTEVRRDVNHENGVKDDNRFSNLRWVTAYENNHHAVINGLSTNVPTVVFDKKGDKIAEFESKSLAAKFGFPVKYQLPSYEYSKEKALDRINRPRKKPEYKKPKFVGCSDFSVTCDPELKARVLIDLENNRSIKDIIKEYGLTYYKVSLLKGTPYMRSE